MRLILVRILMRLRVLLVLLDVLLLLFVFLGQLLRLLLVPLLDLLHLRVVGLLALQLAVILLLLFQFLVILLLPRIQLFLLLLVFSVAVRIPRVGCRCPCMRRQFVGMNCVVSLPAGISRLGRPIVAPAFFGGYSIVPRKGSRPFRSRDGRPPVIGRSPKLWIPACLIHVVPLVGYRPDMPSAVRCFLR